MISKINLQLTQRNRKFYQFNNDQYCTYTSSSLLKHMYVKYSASTISSFIVNARLISLRTEAIGIYKVALTKLSISPSAKQTIASQSAKSLRFLILFIAFFLPFCCHDRLFIALSTAIFNFFSSKFKNVVWDFFHIQYYNSF